MPDFSPLKEPAPYHLLAYGTLLGSSVFQSFIGGVTAFKVLPRPAFATLQSALFPIYFGMQTILPITLALTYPGAPQSVLSPSISTRDSGINALFALDAPHKTSSLIAITVMAVTGALNWGILGPATTKTMKLRKHQETRDGKKSYDQGPHSKEMQDLNKKFGRLHGASSLVNMIGFGVQVWYAFVLARGL